MDDSSEKIKLKNFNFFNFITVKREFARLKIEISGIKLKFRMNDYSKTCVDENNNTIFIKSNKVKANITINGKNNNIFIGNTKVKSNFDIKVNGDNNNIIFNDLTGFGEAKIFIGNQSSYVTNTLLKAGKNLSAGSVVFYIYNPDNKCYIGDNCMFSSNIKIRTGELPHKIYNNLTNENLDYSEGVFIGNNVWLGEEVFLTKRVTLPDNTIVGAKSVVTRKFDEEYTVIAGNPAKVAKHNIAWKPI